MAGRNNKSTKKLQIKLNTLINRKIKEKVKIDFKYKAFLIK